MEMGTNLKFKGLNLKIMLFVIDNTYFSPFSSKMARKGIIIVVLKVFVFNTINPWMKS
jgi:hypothetical protein